MLCKRFKVTMTLDSLKLTFEFLYERSVQLLCAAYNMQRWLTKWVLLKSIYHANSTLHLTHIIDTMLWNIVNEIQTQNAFSRKSSLYNLFIKRLSKFAWVTCTENVLLKLRLWNLVIKWTLAELLSPNLSWSIGFWMNSERLKYSTCLEFAGISHP